MVSFALDLAEQEVLRFLRRRETFWTFLGLGMTLCLVFGAVIWAETQLRDSFRRSLPPSALDDARNVLFLIEALSIWLSGYYLGARTIKQELETGSWILLTQTPHPLAQVFSGKALGAGAVLLTIHSLLSLFVFALTPFTRLSHGQALGGYAVVFALALGAIPEGMAYSWVGRRWPKRTYLLYGVTALRVVFPLVLLHFLVSGRFGEAPASILDVLLAYFRSIVSCAFPTPGSYFGHPAVPVVVLLSWQWLSAAAIWSVLFGRER